MFQVNDKVVCVDDSPSESATEGFTPTSHVRKDVIYVVRGLGSSGGILLVGICTMPLWLGEEVGWNHTRFRKVSEVQSENRLRREKREPRLTP